MAYYQSAPNNQLFNINTTIAFMLQETLKHATQKNHDTLEQLMFVHQIMSGGLSLQQYKQILITNYKVHQRFENTLFNSLNPETAQALQANQRHKLDALLADMRELKIEVPQLPDSGNITFTNQAEILGALYVLEGATLGGNVIIKRLKVNPNLISFNLGFHYYQVYGENLIPYWKQFCAVLNQQPEDTYHDSINGAKKMFEYIAKTQQQSSQTAIA